MLPRGVLSLGAMLGMASAQQFIPPPTGVASILSKNYPGAKISYKETHLCETTPGVRAWSGYVHLPSSLVPDASYDTNLFFWYFESRNNSAQAPTTIYLPGGPGTSFLDGASGFPCAVNADSNSTTLNPWSWNGAANMLYVDSPVQTGFSYTKAQNGTFDLLTHTFSPAEGDTTDAVETNLTTLAATLSSQAADDSLNTTQQVQRTVWLFAQVWLQEFPEHKSANKEVNLWGYSYSGFFVPAVAAYIQRQNEQIRNGTAADANATAVAIQLGTVGMNNGCVDSLSQAASYPAFAHNNTYGLQVIPDAVHAAALRNLTGPGGCLDRIAACRAAAAAADPSGRGHNQTVNALCVAATGLCYGVIQGAFTEYSTRSPFDLALERPGTYPPETGAAFYNQRWVQEALGAPVNYTFSSDTVPQAFFAGTGDPMRYDGKADLEALLAAGVGAAFVYGDRDYRCNWMGAENLTLALDYPDAPAFRSAGYADLRTNGSYAGGLVRQHGGLSFSRVFQAGHAVAAYQPETVFRVFERAVTGRDVATGLVEVAAGGYSSAGPADTLSHREGLPSSPPSVCYLFDLAATCRVEEVEGLVNGTAVVEDFVVKVESRGSNGSDADGGSGSSESGASRGGVSVAAVAALSLGAVLLGL